MTREYFRPPGHTTDTFLLTTVVGSHPQPRWVDELCRCAGDDEIDDATHREAADDSVKAILADYHRAGLDVVTDGEVRRDGMVEHFTRFIDGYDEGTGDGASADWNAHMPTATDRVSSDTPWLVDDFRFARSVSTRPVKVTIPGPFTFASFCTPAAYDDMETLISDFTELVRDEVERLVDAGARWIQLDEPALGMSPHVDIARECVERISTAVPADVRLGLHVCSGNYSTLAPAIFSFAVDEVDLEFASDNADAIESVLDGVDLTVDVSVGVVDSQSTEIESVAEIEERIARVLEVIPPERLTLTPDCGLKPLPREVAFAKVANLVSAARSVEADLDANRLDAVAAD